MIEGAAKRPGEPVEVASTAAADAADAVVAAIDRPQPEANDAVHSAVPPPAEGDGPVFDESAEAAFLAEARERGEKVTTVRPADAAEEVSDNKALPPLDELVKRIPPDVRETLEDLFRARFVAVRRVPAKALKQ